MVMHSMVYIVGEGIWALYNIGMLVWLYVYCHSVHYPTNLDTYAGGWIVANGICHSVLLFFNVIKLVCGRVPRANVVLQFFALLVDVASGSLHILVASKALPWFCIFAIAALLLLFWVAFTMILPQKLKKGKLDDYINGMFTWCEAEEPEKVMAVVA